MDPVDLLAKAIVVQRRQDRKSAWVDRDPFFALAAYAHQQHDHENQAGHTDLGPSGQSSNPQNNNQNVAAKKSKPTTAWGRIAQLASLLTPNVPERVVEFFGAQKISYANALDQSSTAAELVQIDHHWLRALFKERFLTFVPQNHAITGNLTKEKSRAVSDLDIIGAGAVVVAGDLSGRPRHFDLPKTDEQKALARFAVLLHEAAHCEFDHTANPFRPSQTTAIGRTLTDEDVARLNTWSFDGGGNALARSMLNEGFAESYGAMMLLVSTKFAPDTIKTLEHIFLQRQDVNATYQDRGTFAHLACADALEKTLSRIDEWKHLSPQMMKAKALEYASDVLCQWSDPRQSLHLDETIQQERRQLLHIGFPPTEQNPLAMRATFAATLSNAPLDQVINDIDRRWPQKPYTDFLKQITPVLAKTFETQTPEHLQSAYHQSFQEAASALTPHAVIAFENAAAALTCVKMEEEHGQPARLFVNDDHLDARDIHQKIFARLGAEKIIELITPDQFKTLCRAEQSAIDAFNQDLIRHEKTMARIDQLSGETLPAPRGIEQYRTEQRRSTPQPQPSRRSSSSP